MRRRLFGCSVGSTATTSVSWLAWIPWLAHGPPQLSIGDRGRLAIHPTTEERLHGHTDYVRGGAGGSRADWRSPLRDPRYNRGTAFTLDEHRALWFEGLLPAAVLTFEEQSTRASDTVSARTLAAPQPPAALVGAWRRTVTQVQTGSQTAAGTWTLRIDASGWRITDPPGGRNWVDVAYTGAGTLQARGSIRTSCIQGSGGNGWWEDANAPVDYTWQVSGRTLTVTLVGVDRCADPKNLQHFIWEGDWTRVG